MLRCAALRAPSPHGDKVVKACLRGIASTTPSHLNRRPIFSLALSSSEGVTHWATVRHLPSPILLPHSALGTYTPTSPSLSLQGFARLQGLVTRTGPASWEIT